MEEVFSLDGTTRRIRTRDGSARTPGRGDSEAASAPPAAQHATGSRTPDSEAALLYRNGHWHTRHWRLVYAPPHLRHLRTSVAGSGVFLVLAPASCPTETRTLIEEDAEVVLELPPLVREHLCRRKCESTSATQRRQSRASGSAHGKRRCTGMRSAVAVGAANMYDGISIATCGLADGVR